jgi:hypothetical protein
VTCSEEKVDGLGVVEEENQQLRLQLEQAQQLSDKAKQSAVLEAEGLQRQLEDAQQQRKCVSCC